jgi:diaminopimelate epimerase
MRFFNPDGSEAEKSGNGLRIFARYLWDRGYVSGQDFNIRLGGELIQAHIEDDSANTITTTIGNLSFHSGDIPVGGPPREVVEETLSIAGPTGLGNFVVTAVTIGNPHCVIFDDAAGQSQLETLARTAGPAIETAALFPNRTNVQFARVINEHTIEIAIWERGAGYTLASGTSASAAAGAAIKTGRCQSPVQVRMAGGSARVSIDEEWRVTLTGAVKALYKGTFSPDFLTALGSWG